MSSRNAMYRVFRKYVLLYNTSHGWLGAIGSRILERKERQYNDMFQRIITFYRPVIHKKIFIKMKWHSSRGKPFINCKNYCFWGTAELIFFYFPFIHICSTSIRENSINNIITESLIWRSGIFLKYLLAKSKANYWQPNPNPWQQNLNSGKLCSRIQILVCSIKPPVLTVDSLTQQSL